MDEPFFSLLDIEQESKKIPQVDCSNLRSTIDIHTNLDDYLEKADEIESQMQNVIW